MKRFAVILLIACLLCGCAGRPTPTEPSTKATAEPTTTPTEATTTEPSAESTRPEAPVLYRNPLNGTPIDAPWTSRPFAVVINNIKQAMPQHGVSQADMLFEVMAEGGVTRCLALFSDVSTVESLGSIRSARTYLVDLAQAHDAIFAHCGGSSYADKQLSSGEVSDLNATNGSASSYFYRDSARRQAGYAYEHTLFTTGSNLIAYAAKKGFTLTRSDGISYNYLFDSEVSLDGETANSITVNFRKGGKATTMTYNPDTGLYEGYQHKGTYVDGNTGSAMSFRNVLILFVKTTNASDGVHVFNETLGSGDGYFACNGKIVPIQWSRSDKNSAFCYTLTDGTPVTLGVGTSYIALAPSASPLSYE